MFSANFCTVYDFLIGWVRCFPVQKAKTGEYIVCTCRTSSEWHTNKFAIISWQSKLGPSTAIPIYKYKRIMSICYSVMLKPRCRDSRPIYVLTSGSPMYGHISHRLWHSTFWVRSATSWSGRFCFSLCESRSLWTVTSYVLRRRPRGLTS